MQSFKYIFFYFLAKSNSILNFHFFKEEFSPNNFTFYAPILALSNHFYHINFSFKIQNFNTHFNFHNLNKFKSIFKNSFSIFRLKFAFSEKPIFCFSLDLLLFTRIIQSFVSLTKKLSINTGYHFAFLGTF